MKVKVRMKKSGYAQMASSPAKKKKTFLFKNIWAIIIGKSSKDGSFSANGFAALLELLFNTLAIFGIFLFIAMMHNGISLIAAMTWEWGTDIIWANLVDIILMIGLVLCVLVFSLMFRGAANDMKQEKDRNYIIALFSGIVSFAAMIIAFVTLVKG